MASSKIGKDESVSALPGGEDEDRMGDIDTYSGLKRIRAGVLDAVSGLDSFVKDLSLFGDQDVEGSGDDPILEGGRVADDFPLLIPKNPIRPLPEVEEKDELGQAVEKHDLDQVEFLMQVHGNDQSHEFAESLAKAIIRASRQGKFEVLRRLVPNAETLDTPDEAGFTAMHHAAVCTDTAEGLRCAQLMGEVGASCKAGATRIALQPLHVATLVNNTALVELLTALASGEIDAPTRRGDSALHLAASMGTVGLETTQAIIRAGANVRKPNGQGRLAIDLAEATGSKQLCTVLRDAMEAAFGRKQGQPDWQSQLNEALINAVESNSAASAATLLQQRADVNHVTSAGMPLLSVASSLGHDLIVKVLVEAGAEVEKGDLDRATALHHSASCGETIAAVRTCAMLCERGKASVRSRTREHWFTPMHAAVLANNVDVVKYLATRPDYEPNTRTKLGETPLQLIDLSSHVVGANDEASRAESLGMRMLRALLESGEDPRVFDSAGMSPAMWALKDGADAAANLLQSSEVELEGKGVPRPSVWDGEPAGGLVRSVEWNDVKGIRDALRIAPENSVNSVSIGGSGRTCLMRAASLGHVEAVRELLAFGADSGVSEPEEMATALHLACGHARASNAMEIVRLLLERGGEQIKSAIMARTKTEGRLPLHVAAAVGNNEPLRMILEFVEATAPEATATAEVEAMVNTLTTVGDSALHLAAALGNAETVRLLVAAGATMGTEDAEGRVALDIAESFGHKECVDLLRKSTMWELGAGVADACECIGNGRDAAEGEEVVLKLLKAGADMSWMSPERTPLFNIVCGGACLEAIRYMLDANVDINAVDAEGAGPLHYVAGAADESLALRVVRLLVEEQGLDPFRRTAADGLLPLHVACASGKVSVLTYFATRPGATHDVVTAAGDTPMHLAAAYERDDIALKMVKALLATGESSDVLDSMGCTALMSAAGINNLNTASYLMDLPPRGMPTEMELRAQDEMRRRQLDAALDPRKLGIPLLKDVRAQLSTHEHGPMCQLNIVSAAAMGDTTQVTTLMGDGAKLDCIDDVGMTALSAAALAGHTFIVRILLGAETAVDPNAADHSGATALHHAAGSGAIDCVGALLLHGKVDMTLRDRTGQIALHRACAAAGGLSADVVDRLLRLLLSRRMCKRLEIDRSALANAQSDLGDTPLHVIAAHAPRMQEGVAEMAAWLLIRSGASAAVANVSGHTAYDIAKRVVNHETDVGLLKLLDVHARLKKEGKMKVETVPNTLPLGATSHISLEKDTVTHTVDDGDTSEEEEALLSDVAKAGEQSESDAHPGWHSEMSENDKAAAELGASSHGETSTVSGIDGLRRLGRAEGRIAMMSDRYGQKGTTQGEVAALARERRLALINYAYTPNTAPVATDGRSVQKTTKLSDHVRR